MKKPSARGIVCSKYQRLLEESESARRLWAERRSEICRLHLVGKETGDELLQLQAHYANSYVRLERHVHTCPRCRILSRIA